MRTAAVVVMIAGVVVIALGIWQGIGRSEWNVGQPGPNSGEQGGNMWMTARIPLTVPIGLAAVAAGIVMWVKGGRRG